MKTPLVHTDMNYLRKVLGTIVFSEPSIDQYCRNSSPEALYTDVY
jgi:hypothetical protein